MVKVCDPKVDVFLILYVLRRHVNLRIVTGVPAIGASVALIVAKH